MFIPGVQTIDNICQVLLSTSMFVGGMIGMFLDNTIPGEYMDVDNTHTHTHTNVNTYMHTQSHPPTDACPRTH